MATSFSYNWNFDFEIETELQEAKIMEWDPIRNS